MSTIVHLSSPIIPGYGKLLESRCSSMLSSSARIDSDTFPQLKSLSMTCSARTNFVINCSISGNYERDPDYSYRATEDNFDSKYEDYRFKSKYFDPRAGYSKFQAKFPGEKDKEVLEMFRKVKAQLRAKAMSKKEGNLEDLPRRPRKDISALVQVLEKHSNPVTPLPDTNEITWTRITKREPPSSSASRVDWSVDLKKRKFQKKTVSFQALVNEILKDDTFEQEHD